LEGFYSSEDSIDLESKTPPVGFFVVFVKNIDIFAAKVLPLRNRLLYPSSFRKPVSKNGKKS
jgi:hypothetical protein